MPYSPVNYSITGDQPPLAIADQYYAGIDAALGAITAVTNLGFANQTLTTADITSSSGTNATMTSATALLAGLMPAADKVKVDFLTITGAVDLDALSTDVSEHQTLFGVADGSTNFGTFTAATTDYDNLAGKALFQQIITALETIPGSVQSVVADITARDALASPASGDLAYVTDASADATVTSGAALYAYDGAAWQKIAEFESLDVQTDLAFANQTATTADVTSSTGANATLTGATNSLAGLATAAQITNIESLVALSGLAANTTVHPAFTNGIIPSGTTNAALQSVENELVRSTALQADILSAANAINTAGKYDGKRLRITDRSNIEVIAQGSAATDAWVTGDGVYVATPS